MLVREVSVGLQREISHYFFVFDLFSTLMLHSAANLQTSKTKFCLFSELSSLVCSQGKFYGTKFFPFDTEHFVYLFV